VIQADRLIPATAVTELLPIKKEKQWAQFCLFWLRFIKLQCQIPVAGMWIDEHLGDLDIFDVFEPLFPSEYKQLMQLLYLGKDLEQTEQAIIDIINTDDRLKLRLKQFSEGYNG
jgi:hypothetical protein